MVDDPSICAGYRWASRCLYHAAPLYDYRTWFKCRDGKQHPWPFTVIGSFYDLHFRMDYRPNRRKKNNGYFFGDLWYHYLINRNNVGAGAQNRCFFTTCLDRLFFSTLFCRTQSDRAAQPTQLGNSLWTTICVYPGRWSAAGLSRLHGHLPFSWPRHCHCRWVDDCRCGSGGSFAIVGKIG